jgi:hypothetical protein
MGATEKVCAGRVGAVREVVITRLGGSGRSKDRLSATGTTQRRIAAGKRLLYSDCGDLTGHAGLLPGGSSICSKRGKILPSFVPGHLL